MWDRSSHLFFFSFFQYLFFFGFRLCPCLSFSLFLCMSVSFSISVCHILPLSLSQPTFFALLRTCILTHGFITCPHLSRYVCIQLYQLIVFVYMIDCSCVLASILCKKKKRRKKSNLFLPLVKSFCLSLVLPVLSVTYLFLDSVKLRTPWIKIIAWSQTSSHSFRIQIVF